MVEDLKKEMAFFRRRRQAMNHDRHGVCVFQRRVRQLARDLGNL